MQTSNFAEPWHKSLAQELQYLCSVKLGTKLGRQHTIELVAACFNKKSASLFTDGQLVAETPEIPGEIPWHFVEDRLVKTAPNLTSDEIEGVKEILFHLWAEEADHDIALAKRLARNIALNCEHHGGNTYSSSVLLTEEDWRAATEVACRDDFDDGMAETLPWPSIYPFSTAKPEPLYEYRYQLEPGCILNIMAFLLPEDWEELLARYQKLKLRNRGPV